ncbi:hypothetical protein [Nostoc sp. 'Peltigera membranacea cyanobiont' 232]|uniref:hypothetical protein n=1 Tax=Nostoc sp. 'Peltigera membranacea cyanobiont' 232 TaxID=2014531 RepID=UPI000B953698|nr:hypothetical protein [Nostoc sp. 'Peltigera membranacea cyanobiont' 232]OYE02135.1 hypothetical protein CDG79_25540 [Nostoc sp. 'Peltigera membranacea cyanobiont' 232]
MTVNLLSVYSSTVSIPAPLYKLGQQVRWDGSAMPEAIEDDSFMGIITELNYRIDCDASNWQYTMAITTAKRSGFLVDFYVGEYSFDIDEHFLTVCTKYEC